jgi:hypothetical protein
MLLCVILVHSYYYYYYYYYYSMALQFLQKFGHLFEAA